MKLSGGKPPKLGKGKVNLKGDAHGGSGKGDPGKKMGKMGK